MLYKGKIGFFGGTFDPIHFGHLNLAVELLETHQLDEVWFCPAAINPHKQDVSCSPIHHRLKMTELAICSHPSFHLLPIESSREGPSYTIDTLRELTNSESQRPHPRKIFLMMSDETASNFKNWKNP